MAVKIFCNCCQKFIRDAKGSEISSLKGTEVCEPCSKRMKTGIDELDKVAARGISQIQNLVGKYKSELDEGMRRIIEGEKNGANS